MGACARAARAAGGRVLGVMPDFLRQREVLYDDVETVVVRSMHERKSLMFEEADAFAILPGGIGTLEEVIELLSWRRLGLHAKPIVFLDAKGNAIVTSDGPKGNIGYPATPAEIEHFIAMLTKARRRIEPAQVEAIEAVLKAEGKKIEEARASAATKLKQPAR